MTEDYWKDKHSEVSDKLRKLEDDLHIWKLSVGWLIAGIIILAIIGFVVIASVKTQIGYSPEQVGDLAIKICKELK